MAERDDAEGIIIEFHQIGQVVKVSAIDTRSGIEASIVAPANLHQSSLKAAAIRKLRYVMAKKISNTD